MVTRVVGWTTMNGSDYVPGQIVLVNKYTSLNIYCILSSFDEQNISAYLWL